MPSFSILLKRASHIVPAEPHTAGFFLVLAFVFLCIRQAHNTSPFFFYFFSLYNSCSSTPFTLAAYTAGSAVSKNERIVAKPGPYELSKSHVQPKPNDTCAMFLDDGGTASK